MTAEAVVVGEVGALGVRQAQLHGLASDVGVAGEPCAVLRREDLLQGPSEGAGNEALAGRNVLVSPKKEEEKKYGLLNGLTICETYKVGQVADVGEFIAVRAGGKRYDA